MRDCSIFNPHDWSKWEQYKQPFIIIPGFLYPKDLRDRTFTEVEDWQRRICLKCGKVQQEKI